MELFCAHFVAGGWIGVGGQHQPFIVVSSAWSPPADLDRRSTLPSETHYNFMKEIPRKYFGVQTVIAAKIMRSSPCRILGC